MKDTEANPRLIRYFNALLIEFMYEHKPEEFADDEEWKQAFFRFLNETKGNAA